MNSERRTARMSQVVSEGRIATRTGAAAQHRDEKFTLLKPVASSVLDGTPFLQLLHDFRIDKGN